jgi:hypothetical protein
MNKIPSGEMCFCCEHANRRCDHLPFDEYKPIAKPDKDGYWFVRCEEYAPSPIPWQAERSPITYLHEGGIEEIE